MPDPEPTPDTPNDPAEPRAATPAPTASSSPSVPLVLQYSAPSADAADDWVTVWKARDYVEANLAVGRLQELGLHARVDMENAAMIGAWAGTGAAGTSVQAARSDAEAARKLLEEIDARRARRQGMAYLPCPACGHAPAASELNPARKAGITLLFLAPLAGFLLSFVGLDFGYRALLAMALVAVALWLLVTDVTPRWACTKCGHRWAQPAHVPADDDDDL